MMYKIAIVDDEKQSREVIIKLLEKFFLVEDKYRYSYSCFENGEDFLVSAEDFDIVFMDIEMPGDNGIMIAERFRQKDQDASIIFCTNLGQYAIEGYKVNARGYLLKPISSVFFNLFMNKSIEQHQKKRSLDFYIKTELGDTHLSTDSILYLQVQGHNISFYYLKKGEICSVQTRGSLAEYENKLAPYDFVRCSIYSLVNMDYVFSVKNNTITLSEGNTEIAIGRSFKKDFNEKFSHYLATIDQGRFSKKD